MRRRQILAILYNVLTLPLLAQKILEVQKYKNMASNAIYEYRLLELRQIEEIRWVQQRLKSHELRKYRTKFNIPRWLYA